jgi:hypothetical protein
MAEINAQATTKTLIAYTISTDRAALESVLRRNGITLPNNASDKEVTIATLKALKSPSVKSDMVNLLSRKVSSASQDFASFTGLDDFTTFTGLDDFAGVSDQYMNATSINPSTARNIADSAKVRTTTSAKKAARITASNPQGKTGVGLFLQNLGKAVTSQDTINAGLNVGLTSLNNRVQSQSNNLNNEANQIVQTSDAITRQIPAQAKKNNTLTYVMVGIGVLALAGIVYFVAKRK